ncbi:MAG: hypothetical protein HFE83_01750 [Lachnospiraceae bacterium]|jgi:3D (Asp-Asp-Asp) domain-containing protein|nr:hypothetical protein [Lachnospiraceae bacterium]
MSKRIVCRLITAGAALFLTAFASFPTHAAAFAGELKSVTDSQITGWAWNQDETDTAVTVELTLAGANGPGSNAVLTVTADRTLDELENIALSGHGFVCEIDWSAYSGDTFVITAAAVSGERRIPIGGVFTYKKEEGAAKRAAKPTASGPAGKDKPVLFDSDLNRIGPGFGDDSATRVETASHSSDDSVQASEKHSGPASAAKNGGVQGELIGTFRASGYCACSVCSSGSGLTYSGKPPKANHTIAADLSLYPLGTKLMIDGTVYTVEDTGGSIMGNRLDIYFDDHETALNYGIQTVTVYSVK